MSTTGDAYCWGSGGFGDLGNGTVHGSSVPSRVVGLPARVESISVGEEFACAVIVGGRGYCWGLTNYGQGGTGVESTINDSAIEVAAP